MTYDSVFISDVHLGTNRCNIKKFINFLDTINTKKLVMVGDIFDIECMQKYGTQWKKKHTEAFHKLINLSKSGVEIIYILGNHEAELRRYSGFSYDNFLLCNSYEYVTNTGEKYLCVHGDAHSKCSSGSWKQICFNKGYEIITPLSYWLSKIFNFSLVHFLKNTISAKKYINQYEIDLSSYCRELKDYDGIICGHIHHAKIRNFNKITYMCCGDFVDTNSAIVEKDGEFKITFY